MPPATSGAAAPTTPGASSTAAPATSTAPTTPATPAASAASATGASAAPVVPPPSEESRSTDVYEDPSKTYYFIGARYRGNVLPQFVLNWFIDKGQTFYSNSVGIEFDIRKDGLSRVLAISYAEYGSGGDVLFLEKGKPATANNWSNINSSIKVVNLTADFLWSKKLHPNVDFEYGIGVGISTVFGSLENSWVYDDPNGPYKDPDSGRRFSPCITEADGGNDKPCDRRSHSNSDKAKVNHYEEPTWFGGGSLFNFWPYVAPQVALRVKPIKELQTRLNVGISTTGIFFGLSANYGLEKALEKKSTKP
ncbi:hypothetical protein [Pendulispora albinea]|uniref:Uncharacterized protein n=1 Tax=Pendulispora albinea TaxID=2741071 RepID=A0ABZ2M4I0_9BACT